MQAGRLRPGDRPEEERPEGGAGGRPQVPGARGAPQLQQHLVGGGRVQPGHNHARARHRLGLTARRRGLASAAPRTNTGSSNQLAQLRPDRNNHAHDRARSFEVDVSLNFKTESEFSPLFFFLSFFYLFLAEDELV